MCVFLCVERRFNVCVVYLVEIRGNAPFPFPLSPFFPLEGGKGKGERGIVSNLNEIDDNNIETALNAVDHLQMILTCFGRV